ncbi:hypothetical protein POTOM_013293 [Populus tomentosa]|uniref:Uncharacterized protein n=1 Tax=Populus tomentosa TaxID=118781 RepID=A0A8X8A4J4_POPTO|nr:hypothetical protein POTOM_013293 [Populus tomentosa]
MTGKFRNELPDPSAQPKLMPLKREKDRFTKYTITSLEKMYKPQLYVEPDLGIPLDLLDLSVYNPPSVRPLLAPEDEELLHDDESVTPVKRDGIKRKERPTDKGVSWLVKTQYISPLSMESAKLSLTEKQAKELREMKGGCKLLDNLNKRERQIKEIRASFASNKLPPVHATNKNLKPIEILPLLPDFDRPPRDSGVKDNTNDCPEVNIASFSEDQIAPACFAILSAPYFDVQQLRNISLGFTLLTENISSKWKEFSSLPGYCFISLSQLDKLLSAIVQ